MRRTSVKERLDVLLVQRGLAESRTHAQRLIGAGEVRVDGEVVDKAGTRVEAEAALEVAQRPAFASRGGHKLDAALEAFMVPVTGRVALDVGASTGGFTDVLLQRGAAKVYALDVGYGQLAWELRQDPRVVVMERTNIRHVESLPELVEMVVIDVSFISLRLVLPVVARLAAPGAQIVALIKPQFEVGKGMVGKGGVVRDPALHRQVLAEVLGWARENGFEVRGLIRSPIVGPAGNVEFLMHLVVGQEQEPMELEPLIERVTPE
jgi:23S rRNA (cytidine1920-2'-O)/16S rRNA (cytidine1409-2'-O)-methyltransferase